MAVELRVQVGKLRHRLRQEALLGDLSEPQIRVMVMIQRGGPSTVAALARAEGVKPQSMGQTVAALRENGMLEGVPDPADGRQTLLRPTATFEKRLQASRAAREDWLGQAIERRLSVAEQRCLADALGLLGRLSES